MIIEILSSALLALMTTSAWAQENDTKTDEWAPKDHVKISINAGPQWNSSLGCLAGVDVHIPLGQSRWGFEPGLYWSFRNHTEEQTENNDKEEYNDKVHYLEVPLHFSVRVAGYQNGPFNLSVFYGPYLAYGLNGTSHYTLTKDGEVTKSEANAFSDKGRLRSRFDFGLNLGLKAVIKQHLKVGVFTQLGCRHIYKPISDLAEFFGDLLGHMTMFNMTKNNIGVGITVGYQF